MQQSPGLPMRPRTTAQSDVTRLGAEAEVAVMFAPSAYLLDPNPVTRALLVEYLRDKGFDIVATADTEASPPSVDVLIVALDGLEQRANRPQWLLQKPGTPIVVLDRPRLFPGRAVALGYAPDARLSLPVQPRKLVATIRQVLSLARTASADPDEARVRIYRFSGWTLHCEERRLAAPDGQSALLDKREFKVLRALLAFPRQVLIRQQLIDLAWGPGKNVKNRALDRPITCLRRLLGDDARFPRLIKTVVGTGYRLEADVEKSL